ncbi:unnamed protein product, partial [Mesorhabditis belari]|uniref:Septin n=1 Tax=Mesorhabditis belari TaxID=2138241 RepID=A0AAF3EB00_9BILA
MTDLLRKPLVEDQNPIGPVELSYDSVENEGNQPIMMNFGVIPSKEPPAIPMVRSERVPLSPLSPSSNASPRTLELNGNVGFDTLPHQMVKKAIEQGFHFNLMCVGETGLGKTTLIESLFNMKLEFDSCDNELTTVELRSKKYEVMEGGIRLRMTIVETAGFGDQLDKDKSASLIAKHLNDQFEKYFKEELKIRRMLSFYEDTRIHACLYFISPTGLGLKALDLVTLRELSKRVNVIPIIAKSDTISKDDLIRFKSKILSELAQNHIEIYQFPTDDETVAEINSQMNKFTPFAVIGSTDFVKKDDGKFVRARRYPWGIVEVENEDHCDFVKLRDALLRTNVDSLRERTHSVLYENYRRERLRSSMNDGDGDAIRFIENCAQKMQKYTLEMRAKEKELEEEYDKRLAQYEAQMQSEEQTLMRASQDVETRYIQQNELLDAEMRNVQEEKERIELKLKKGKK